MGILHVILTKRWGILTIFGTIIGGIFGYLYGYQAGASDMADKVAPNLYRCVELLGGKFSTIHHGGGK